LFYKDFFLDDVEFIHIEWREDRKWAVGEKRVRYVPKMELVHESIYSSVIYLSTQAGHGVN